MYFATSTQCFPAVTNVDKMANYGGHNQETGIEE